MSDPTRQRIVATHPAMTSVGVERNLRFGGSAEVPLHLDLYRPPNAKGSLSPVVVFVSGYSDPGFAKVVGCRFKEMGAYVSWAELLAANGITAVTYENVDPPADVQTLLDYLRDQADQLDIDPKRMAIWAASGNAPTALALMDRNELTCAVVSYGYLLDLDGHTDVADAAAQFRFSNAAAGLTLDSFRSTPLLLVRAGHDEMPGLNATMDRFVAGALERNMPVSLINYPDGAHAFDLVDDSEEAHRTIAGIVAFFLDRLHVGANAG